MTIKRQRQTGKVQQQSAATAPTSTDPQRPEKTSDLRQRPSATILRLVCIQKARGSSPLSSTGQRPLAILRPSEQSQTKSQSRRTIRRMTATARRGHGEGSVYRDAAGEAEETPGLGGRWPEDLGFLHAVQGCGRLGRRGPGRPGRQDRPGTPVPGPPRPSTGTSSALSSPPAPTSWTRSSPRRSTRDSQPQPGDVGVMAGPGA